MAIFFDITYLDINFDILAKSDKYLTIIFLVTIALTNCVLLIMSIIPYCCGQAGIRNTITTPSGSHPSQTPLQSTARRRAVFVSMSLAGLVLSFFTFTILAILLFQQQDHGLGCLAMNLARIYSDEFLPVLYACALFLVAVDVIIVQKSHDGNKKKTFASVANYSTPNGENGVGDGTSRTNYAFATTSSVIFCLTLPWVISLVVVCPLTLSNVDWGDSCKSEQSKRHTQARIGVCTLLPALVTLVSGLCALLWETSGRDDGKSSDETDTFEFPMYQDPDNLHLHRDLDPRHNKENPMTINNINSSLTTKAGGVVGGVGGTFTNNRNTNPLSVQHEYSYPLDLEPYYIGYSKYTGAVPQQISTISSSSFDDYKFEAENQHEQTRRQEQGQDQGGKSPKPKKLNHHHRHRHQRQRNNNDTDDNNRYRLVLFVSCVVFILTVVPYNALCLYVMERYDDQTVESTSSEFVYKVDTAVFITVHVFSWVQAIYPAFLPLVCLVTASF